MTLKLQKNPTFTATVTATIPTDDGPVVQDFRVRFRVLPDAEWSEQADIREVLKRAVVSVQDVVGDDGEAIASSPDLIEQIVGTPFLRPALAQAYWQTISGARAGN